MLRRRILASAMASVMAIGSVAVVASADETAAATTQVKTKADLEAYVKSFDSFRSDKIYDYGSISGERFLDAIEYADNVLADDKATVDDYTVAYSMIEAVYNKLAIYTAEELKALITNTTKIYNTNNICNEELGDLIYTADSFSKFEKAYDEAQSFVASSDSRIITDAYEMLEAAKDNLSALDIVSKSQFRTAIKAYEAALQKEFAYDSWRIGTVDTGWAYWGYQDQTVAYGTLYEHAASLEDAINDAYKQLDSIKTLNKTTLEDIVTAYNSCVAATTVLNGFKGDDTNRATKANVKSLLNEYHGRLVHDYATTDAEDLYKAVLATLNVTTGVTNTVYVKQAKGAYSTDMVDVTTVTNPWYVDSAEYTVNPNDTHTGTVVKDISAEISIRIDSDNGTNIYIELDDEGYATGNVYTDKKDIKTGHQKLVSKGSTVDLTEYIRVAAANVKTDVDNHLKNNVSDGDAPFTKIDPSTVNWAGEYSNGVSHTWSADTLTIGKWGSIEGASQEMDGMYTNSSDETVATYANLATAMKLAEVYLTGDKADIKASDIYGIDTTGKIADGTASGSTNEWTLVYRYLKYALSDKYDAAYGTHTRAEVVALIEDCYDLAELTGDASLFTANHNALVTARQDALDWVKASNKIASYKDNVTAVKVDSKNTYVATQVYDNLKDAYDNLMDDYNAFKYSFGEIYNKIADVKTMIEDGDLAATESLVAALEDVSYRLSIVETLKFDDGNDVEDNDAFTSDRFFQSFNRVFTNEEAYKMTFEDNSTKKVADAFKDNEAKVNASHHYLKEAYEALIAEVEKQTNPEVKLGDVNGDGLVNALDASAILKASLDGTVIDVKVGDVNADGLVNALDASAILKMGLNLA